MANNKRLIDVEDCPCDGCQAKPCGHPAKCVKFAKWLNKTIDAVEVVRCEKCRYRSQYPNGIGLYKCGGMGTPDDLGYIAVRPQDYCANGERRTDGNL